MQIGQQNLPMNICGKTELLFAGLLRLPLMIISGSQLAMIVILRLLEIACLIF
jgi:hypothetical protein